MKEKTFNPNFTYEISCDQMCGKNHFSMRGVIIVEKEEDYKLWLASQKPEYFTIFPDKAPKPGGGTQADTTKKSAPLAAVIMPAGN